MSDSDVTSDCSSHSHRSVRSDSGSDDDSQEGQSNPSESETPTDSSSEEENRNISTDDSDNGNKKTNRKAKKQIDNDEEQDPKIQTPKKKTDKKEWLTIGGLNVQSLLAKGKDKKKDKMRDVRNLIEKHNIDIFVLGETWLPLSWTQKQLKKELAIEGTKFKLVRQDRTYHKKLDTAYGRRGGGLIVYIHKDIKFKVTSFWEWPENNVQFLEISIEVPKFDLIAIYNPNKSHEQCVINLMSFFLKRNKVLNTPVMFVGDLNLDPKEEKLFELKLTEFERDFKIRPLIKEVTHGKRCIDHIITNIDADECYPKEKSPEDCPDISQHKFVMCKVNKSTTKLPCSTKISTLIQPKDFHSRTVTTLLKDLLSGKDKQAGVWLNLFCEFNKQVKVSSCIEDAPVYTSHLSIQTINKSTDIGVLVTKMGQGMTTLEKKITAHVVSTQCTISSHHQSMLTLGASDNTVNWTQGNANCFLLKYTDKDAAEKLLYKFPTCVKDECFKFFNTKVSLCVHELQDHQV